MTLQNILAASAVQTGHQTRVLILYLDNHGLLWVLDPKLKQQYILDVGLRSVYETKWSSDSQLVAVRAEDRISVFEVPCQNSNP